MNKIVILATTVALASFGCKKKKPEEAVAPGSDMGSAPAGSGSGSGSAMAAGSGSAAAAKPMTAEDMSKRFEQCWGYFNDAKWDDFKGCYAADGVDEAPGAPMPPATGPDAIGAFVKGFKDAFPDMKGEHVLELVSGHNLVAVNLITGTNDGPFKTPMGEMPPTKKKIGLMMAQVFEFDDTGHAKHEWAYFDLATMMGQIKPDPKMPPVRPVMDKTPMAKEVVVAKDDAKEKANVETSKKAAEAFSKHDAKAFGDVVADDVKWSEQQMAKDWDKKEIETNLGALWKGFSDAKITIEKSIAAGDYTANVGRLEATNDGDLPMMHIKKTGKKVDVPFLIVFKIDNGKIKNAWLFEQGIALAGQLGLLPPPKAN